MLINHYKTNNKKLETNNYQLSRLLSLQKLHNKYNAIYLKIK